MVNWKDDAVRKRLLLAIWAVHGPEKLEVGKIAELMGPGCTAKAISHQIPEFKKLRDSLKSGTYDNSEAGKGDEGTKSTAKKRKGFEKGQEASSKKQKTSMKMGALDEMKDQPGDVDESKPSDESG